MKYLACIEYNGSNYCGWQRLGHAASVQAEIERVFSKIANHPVDITCAGRTDSGVHALGQIIHFESVAQRDIKAWLMGANTNLPDDIVVRHVQTIDEDFHARFSALSRCYRYIIANQPTRPAILQKRVSWHYMSLDAGLMHQAAQGLLGEHDFSSFRASGCQARHAVREIQSISIQRQGFYVYVDICANAFLHHMVRNIVGSLLQVGEKAQPIEWITDLLGKRDRTQAGVTAKPDGLYLVSVKYPQQYKIPCQVELPAFNI